MGEVEAYKLTRHKFYPTQPVRALRPYACSVQYPNAILMQYCCDTREISARYSHNTQVIPGRAFRKVGKTGGRGCGVRLRLPVRLCSFALNAMDPSCSRHSMCPSLLSEILLVFPVPSAAPDPRLAMCDAP